MSLQGAVSETVDQNAAHLHVCDRVSDPGWQSRARGSSRLADLGHCGARSTPVQERAAAGSTDRTTTRTGRSCGHVWNRASQAVAETIGLRFEKQLQRVWTESGHLCRATLNFPDRRAIADR